MNDIKYAAGEWQPCDKKPDFEYMSELVFGKVKVVPLLIKLVNDPNVYIGKYMRFGPGDYEWHIAGENLDMTRLLEKWAVINI